VSIITEYPSWFVLLCALTGVVYAGALYLRDRFNRTYGTLLAIVLSILRFTGVSVLAFFLLKPLIRTLNLDTQKPILVVAVDNSQSLAMSADSASYQNGQFKTELDAMIAQFGDKYEVRTYQFGSAIQEGIDSLNFSDKLTDISSLADDLYNRLSGRNLGAVIVASDGLYNKGSNPGYAFKRLNVPVFSIALGDTTVRKDVLIADVANNRLAYLGNKFPVEITAQAKKASGEKATLTLSKKGKVLHSEEIVFSNENFTKTVNLVLDANEVGLQRYSIQISSVSGEVTLVNNHKDIFVDVLDSRQKVLVLGAVPHPDMAALSDALSQNESYKIETALVDQFEGNIGEYSLVIFHQLPAVGAKGLAQVKSALDQNVPSLFVWGSATDFRAFNDLQLGYALNSYNGSSSDIKAGWNEGFALFEPGERTLEMFSLLSPLTVPFGEFSFSPGATTLLNRQVGNIKTKTPLISFNKLQDNKIGLISGEGIWRWKMTSFLQFESHEPFTEFVTKIMQYLASKEDKSFFRVNGKNDFPEDQPVIFDAELYNGSYEAIKEKEVRMRVTNDEGQEYSYTFSPYGDRYRLDMGQLPVGNYSYVATANNGVEDLTEKGEFSVSQLHLETVNTVADHGVMYQMAHDNGGEMVSRSTMNSLVDKINARQDIVAIEFENKKLDDLIDYKWLLGLILFLFGLEWLLRKRAGTY
jgi:hypothetical protein